MKNSSITSKSRLLEPAPVELSRLGRAFAGAIRMYQRLTSGRVSACRFYPSCSSYALEAIQNYGAWRGSGLALRRVSRCRPFGPHGVDLVPHPQARSTPR